MRALSGPVEPMRMNDIHTEGEREPGQAVSRSAVKNWLANHLQGDQGDEVWAERVDEVLERDHAAVCGRLTTVATSRDSLRTDAALAYSSAASSSSSTVKPAMALWARSSPGSAISAIPGHEALGRKAAENRETAL